MSVTAQVTGVVGVPTIGIGAGPDCDGQVLILHDMLGINERTPKHAKHYANLGDVISDAVSAYVRKSTGRVLPPLNASPHFCGTSLKQFRPTS